MTELCTRLSLFLDGELDPVDAENFRHHLVSCAACETGLREGFQLELLALGTFAEDEVEVAALPPPAPPRRWWVPFASGGGVALAAAAVVLFVVVRPGAREVPDLWFEHAPSRQLQERLSYPRADTYRPYDPSRGAAGDGHPELGGSPLAPLPLAALAELADREEWRGIAAAYLLHGDAKQAAEFLQKEPPSAARENDRAVVAMRRQDWQGALGLLRQALQANPEYPQALWNRGVVFRELGVTELAEHDFAAVEALDESGWSGEAYTLVTELRRERAERQRHRAAEVARLLERLSSDGRLPDEELKARPVLARAALYEAVRSAESTSRVKGLLPLATALDQLDGGEPLLRGYVHQVAARDFTVRAPLARAYAALLRDPNASSAELLERLRASGERDILLGALLRERSRAEHEELLRLARESNEPLFILLSEREVTRRELAAGHRQRAEQRLLSALRTCQAAKLPPPVCAGLD